MPDMNKSVSMPTETERKDVMDIVRDRAKDAAAGAERVLGAAKEKAKDVKDAAKEKVSDAATAAGELAVQVKDKVREWGVSAGEETRDVAREVTDLVRRYPIQSLVVGVAVGYLVARATTRS